MLGEEAALLPPILHQHLTREDMNYLVSKSENLPGCLAVALFKGHYADVHAYSLTHNVSDVPKSCFERRKRSLFHWRKNLEHLIPLVML